MSLANVNDRSERPLAVHVRANVEFPLKTVIVITALWTLLAFGLGWFANAANTLQEQLADQGSTPVIVRPPSNVGPGGAGVSPAE